LCANITEIKGLKKRRAGTVSSKILGSMVKAIFKKIAKKHKKIRIRYLYKQKRVLIISTKSQLKNFPIL